MARSVSAQSGPGLSAADRTRLERALAAFDAARTGEAEAELRELSERYPKQFEVVETLGLIYAERGEVERALPLLRAACDANPNSSPAAANLGAAYLKLNRIPEAVSTLARATALDPENANTQRNYGSALMAAKNPAGAAEAFSKAATQSPGDNDLLYNWAVAAFASAHILQAAGILTKIPPSAHNAQIDSLCGDVEEKLGHIDRALSCLQDAAKLDESEANLNAFGVELLRHWSFEPAIKTFQYGISKYPASNRLRTGLGIALYADAKYADAADVFAALLGESSTPQNAKLLGWSCIAVKIGSDTDCKALINYARGHPTDIEAKRLAAAAILARHDESRFSVARSLLTSANLSDPHSAQGFYYLGVLDQEEGEWGKSLGPLRRADYLHHDSSKTHLRLALAYAHLGNRVSAQEEAEIQKHLRQLEDSEMENRRKEIQTFALTTR